MLCEIENKAALLAWSAIGGESASYVAIGTKDSGGIGFDDYGGELALYDLALSPPPPSQKSTSDTSPQTTATTTPSPSPNKKPACLATTKTTSRFASLSWSSMATKSAAHPLGLLAGGMLDGTVNIWDPLRLTSKHPTPQLTSISKHKGGPVSALQFNPHVSSSHLLASGGSDGEIYICSLDNPGSPNIFIPAPPPNTTRHTSEITSVAWNTQVAHIVGSSSSNGSAIVWDLRQKKPWCELRESQRTPISALAWNPMEGLHMVTASSSDDDPVIKLWDLRASTTLPLATLQGHTQGVLGVSWCSHDSRLLMSCGKDNKCVLWDLHSLKMIDTLPNESSSSTPQSSSFSNGNGGASESGVAGFGGVGGNVQSKRYDVKWSPHVKGVIATCSFDRKVQCHNMISVGAGTTDRPPKWLVRKGGVCMGFGGRVVKFGSKANPTAGAVGSDGSAVPNRSVVCETFVEETRLKSKSTTFESAMLSQDYKGFSKVKAEQAKAKGKGYEHDVSVWGFMQIIYEENAREQLLAYLGFDAEEIARVAMGYGVDVNSEEGKGEYKEVKEGQAQDQGDAEQSLSESASNAFDGDAPTASIDSLSLTTPTTTTTTSTNNSNSTPSTPMPKDAEEAVKRALLVGNFTAAVHICFQSNQLSDALILSSCGGADLWANTQAKYFELQGGKRSFLGIVKAVINQELSTLVQTSDLTKWMETLAILSTYGKSEEFPLLCEQLGSLLEDGGYGEEAALCYMCSLNVDKSVGSWVDALIASNSNYNANAKNGDGGGIDVEALQEFIEKVSIFSQGSINTTAYADNAKVKVNEYLAIYANVLAEQGLFDVAERYAKLCTDTDADAGGSKVKVLRERLFHASGGGGGGVEFPFVRVEVGVEKKGGYGQSQMQNQQNQQTQQPQQQQQQGQQQQRQQQQQSSQPAAAPQAPQMQPGWLAMQDPASGRTYYANQQTGETRWEAPVSVQQPAPVPLAKPVVQPVQQPVVQQQFGQTQQYGQSQGQPQQQQQQYGQQMQQPQRPVQQQYGQPQQQQQQQVQPQQHVQQMHVQQPSQPQQVQAQQPQVQQQAPLNTPNNNTNNNVSMASLSSKYGDGFVSSASNPELAAQYGNTHTANPYNGVARPGHAAPGAMAGGNVNGGGGGGGGVDRGRDVSVSSSSSNGGGGGGPVETAEISETARPIVDGLNSLIASLGNCSLNASEKKQIEEIKKSTQILKTVLHLQTHHPLDSTNIELMNTLVQCIQSRDYAGAGSVQSGLCNTIWREHKEWLKGIKFLILLATKKL